jgi:hypothetical protein
MKLFKKAPKIETPAMQVLSSTDLRSVSGGVPHELPEPVCRPSPGGGLDCIKPK